jgi:class 3 adenylate cyclase
VAYQVCLYSLGEARRAQSEMRWKILGAGVASLIGALLVSMLLSHGLSVPIRELVAGTQQIQKGNLQVQVRVRSQDEIGQLASSFNEMTIGLALKERYRKVLNLVSDEKVAHRLMNEEIKLGGELRFVSILFCDIRGFTALTEKMPPETVIQMLNEHMAALTSAVKAHNGVVDKFVGDMIMAVFGAPFSHGNDALDAAKCALDLLTARKELNRISRFNMEVGIGLATGDVVAGNMGSEQRLNYTVLGERVNLASRLCHEAAPGVALVDETTAAQVETSLSLEPAKIAPLKGFSSSIRAFRLMGARVSVAPTPVSHSNA